MDPPHPPTDVEAFTAVALWSLLLDPQNGELWVWPSLGQTPLQLVTGWFQGPALAPTQFKEGCSIFLFIYNLLFLFLTVFKLCTWIRNDNIKSQVQYLFYRILPLNVLRSGPIIKAIGVETGEAEKLFCCCFLTKCNILHLHSTTVYHYELCIKQQIVKSPGSWNTRTRYEFLLYHLLVVWSWVSCFTS